MSDTTRRDFLTAGAAFGGAMALNSMASAQTTRPSTKPMDGMHGMMHGPMKDLVPGAVDDQGKYVLPPLPYPYDAVSAAIDEQTMRLHHDKHHQGYVNGLINAEKKLAEARQSGDYSLVEYWSREAAFNGAGHFLHAIFWDSMGPEGMGGRPSGDFAKAIERDFGSFDAMVAHFTAASKSVEGSGWGIMAYSLPADKLIILQALNHQMLSQWAVIPLLVIDVWEHAYYLRYQNNRGAYVDNFPKVINWKRVGQRFDIARGAMGM